MGGNSFEKDWEGIQVDEYNWIKPEPGYYDEHSYSY